jgi:hypothetical protein
MATSLLLIWIHTPEGMVGGGGGEGKGGRSLGRGRHRTETMRGVISPFYNLFMLTPLTPLALILRHHWQLSLPARLMLI